LKIHAFVSPLRPKVSSGFEFHIHSSTRRIDIPSLKELPRSLVEGRGLPSGRALFLSFRGVVVISILSSFFSKNQFSSFQTTDLCSSGCRSALAQHAFLPTLLRRRSFGSCSVCRTRPIKEEGSSKTLVQGPQAAQHGSPDWTQWLRRYEKGLQEVQL
jgi:hypothetical protein